MVVNSNLFDDLRAALYSIWHRRWLALGIASGVCVFGWIGVALIPNRYESRTRIYVQLEDALSDQIGIGNDRRRDMQRVRDTLTSAVNIEKVVRATRLGEGVTTPQEMEQTVQAATKTIKVVSQQDNLFEITASSGYGSLSDADNAKLARDVAQKMIDIFRSENLATNQGEMNQTMTFMDQQLADRQRALDEADRRRAAFEAQHPELAQGGASMLQRLEQGRAELRGIDGDITAAQSALAAINGQLAGTPQTLIVPGAGGGARGSLAQAQADLAAMRARGLTDNHPDVIAVRNQIANLRAVAAGEGNGGGQPNPAYSTLQSIRAERQASLQGLVARRASIQAEIAQVSAQQLGNPEAAAEAQRIVRDYDVLKQQYDKLLADREELRLRGQVENEHNAVKFQVIEPPTTPLSPAAPNRPILLAFVLLAGLGAGIGGAFATGQLRSTFATASRLERATGLPVLGTISHTLSSAGRELRRRRMRHFVACTAALGGLFVLLMVVEFIQRSTVA